MECSKSFDVCVSKRVSTAEVLTIANFTEDTAAIQFAVSLHHVSGKFVSISVLDSSGDCILKFI